MIIFIQFRSCHHLACFLIAESTPVVLLLNVGHGLLILEVY